MVTSTLLFESGIMKISDYDPIHDRYETRTLQLPCLPLFDHFDLPLFEPSSTPHPLSSRKKRPVTQRTMSRFIEYFEMVDTTDASSTVSTAYSTSSTLRSSKSTSTKKTTQSTTTTPRRCHSNPNMSKKHMLMKIESLNRVTPSKASSTKAPKRSLSNAFHVLSGLLPKSKRRLDKVNQADDDDDNDDDASSRLSVSSSSTTIRLAWQGTTWVDEMKTSDDFGSRQRLSSFDQTRPWWTTTLAPLSIN
ncbi:hypothetical protein BC941DRAFT_465993 [Chlamydoabsidia padenii]|nr:hypothetical protein BC941DRAFT_465993 [Chlamydoabsidia padenii]